MENRKKSRIWDTSWILISHSKFKFPGLQHLSRKLDTVVQRFQYSHQWSTGLKCWISQKRPFWLRKSQNTYKYPLGGRKSSIVYAWLRVWFKTISAIFHTFQNFHNFHHSQNFYGSRNFHNFLDFRNFHNLRCDSCKEHTKIHCSMKFLSQKSTTRKSSIFHAFIPTYTSGINFSSY